MSVSGDVRDSPGRASLGCDAGQLRLQLRREGGKEEAEEEEEEEEA